MEPRSSLLRSLNSSLYSSHHSTSTEHSTANAKDHAIGQSPVTNNTGRTLSFLYVIASYIMSSYNIASYNVIRQSRTQKGRHATAREPFRMLRGKSALRALVGLSEALKQCSKHKKRDRRR